MHLIDSKNVINKKDTKSSIFRYKKEIFSFYILYIIINCIVVFKYGTRQNYIDPWLLTLCYSAFLVAVLFLNLKFSLKESTYKYLFFAGSILFLFLSIWLNIHVDKYGLQVDRWSAMEVCIKAIIHGEYPYSAIDHLQGRSSNLPSLIFIGIPFYLLGDVGYLQSFTFVIFVVVIYSYFKTFRVRLWALLTIIFSSTYCYDIYVKSDIISNFILLLAFVVMSLKFFNRKNKAALIFNSIGSALLLMTRIVTVIPLILLLFKPFIKMSAYNKGIFVSIFIAVIVLFCGITFMNAGSFENFMNFNPFYLQNSQMPFLLSLICILLSITYSFYTKGIEPFIKTCTLILSLTVFLSLISKTFEFGGFYNSILNSRFDISYFNFIIPFLIFYMAMLFNKITEKNHHQK